MRSRPPTGSRPINETEWSGDHQAIKEHLGLSPTDRVYIDPRSNVWAENPEGTWENHGAAADFTSGGGPVVAEAETALDRFSGSAGTERYHIILRIRHPDLDPAEITAALCWKPHHSWKRGDQVMTPRGNKLSRLRSDGLWSRTFRYQTRGEIAEHLDQILNHLLTRKDLFQELHKRGAQSALYLQLPGNTNNGDNIDWKILKKFVGLRIVFEIETFPDWA